MSQLEQPIAPGTPGTGGAKHPAGESAGVGTRLLVEALGLFGGIDDLLYEGYSVIEVPWWLVINRPASAGVRRMVGTDAYYCHACGAGECLHTGVVREVVEARGE